MDTKTLLVSDHFGVYVPKCFVDDYNLVAWGLDVGDPDVACVANGPDEEWYWEAWYSIMNKAKFVGKDGKVYHLHQDGDLWAVCWDDIADEVESARSFG